MGIKLASCCIKKDQKNSCLAVLRIRLMLEIIEICSVEGDRDDYSPYEVY